MQHFVADLHFKRDLSSHLQPYIGIQMPYAYNQNLQQNLMLGTGGDSSLVPGLFAATDPGRNLRLKGGWPESEPIVVNLIDQAAALFGAELHQPIQRSLLWTPASRHDYVHRQA